MVKILQLLIKKFWSAFLWALLHVLAERIGPAAENILAMVNNLETTGLPGKEKAAKLYEQLKNATVIHRKNVADTILKLAGEVAVNIVKGKI